MKKKLFVLCLLSLTSIACPKSCGGNDDCKNNCKETCTYNDLGTECYEYCVANNCGTDTEMKFISSKNKFEELDAGFIDSGLLDAGFIDSGLLDAGY